MKIFTQYRKIFGTVRTDQIVYMDNFPNIAYLKNIDRAISESTYTMREDRLIEIVNQIIHNEFDKLDAIINNNFINCGFSKNQFIVHILLNCNKDIIFNLFNYLSISCLEDVCLFCYIQSIRYKDIYDNLELVLDNYCENINLDLIINHCVMWNNCRILKYLLNTRNTANVNFEVNIKIACLYKLNSILQVFFEFDNKCCNYIDIDRFICSVQLEDTESAEYRCRGEIECINLFIDYNCFFLDFTNTTHKKFIFLQIMNRVVNWSPENNTGVKKLLFYLLSHNINFSDCIPHESSSNELFELLESLHIPRNVILSYYCQTWFNSCKSK